MVLHQTIPPKVLITELLIGELKKFVTAVRLGEDDSTLQLCITELASDTVPRYRAYVDSLGSLKKKPVHSIERRANISSYRHRRHDG